MRLHKRIGAALLGAAGVLALAGCSFEKNENTFTPKLDTDKKVIINTVGYFGNFEALDTVTNDFNKYYPNVEFTYEQTSTNTFGSYISSNGSVDIFMTSDEITFRFPELFEEISVDLSKEDIDLSDIDPDMLSAKKINGKLLSIPMGQSVCGIIVNTSLLKKNGLSVPTNYAEFLTTLGALKELGYIPIQGPDTKVYAELTKNMVFDILLSDKNLYNDLLSGKESVVTALSPVMEKLDELLKNGYTDDEINMTYPNDNYDKAILKFFEGDVPFWVCGSESVSGMKKRESKSEAFKSAPFEYTYIYPPLGESGVYSFSEPWYGFSLNKNAANYDYALEFIRFLATSEEINKIADTKGVPSVAENKSDVKIYKNINTPEKSELNCINDGSIDYKISVEWYSITAKYVKGECSSSKEALEEFVRLCSRQGE